MGALLLLQMQPIQACKIQGAWIRYGPKSWSERRFVKILVIEIFSSVLGLFGLIIGLLVSGKTHGFSWMTIGERCRTNRFSLWARSATSCSCVKLFGSEFVWRSDGTIWDLWNMNGIFRMHQQPDYCWSVHIVVVSCLQVDIGLNWSSTRSSGRQK